MSSKKILVTVEIDRFGKGLLDNVDKVTPTYSDKHIKYVLLGNFHHTSAIGRMSISNRARLSAPTFAGAAS